MQTRVISQLAFFVLLIAIPTAAVSATSLIIPKINQTHHPTTVRVSSLSQFSTPPPPAAHDPLWIQTYGGLNDDNGYSITELSGGNFVIAGSTKSYGGGGADSWLVCTDPNGNHLWNQTYGGSDDEFSYSLAAWSVGFAIAGSVNRAGDLDAWLVVTDASGGLYWNKSFGYSGDDSGKCVVKVSGAGGFAITGYTDSSEAGVAGGKDAWLVRTDVGGLTWSKSTYGGSLDDEGYSLVECSGGGFAIVGDTHSFGAGGSDVWLVRTDAVGNPLWNRTYGGTDSDSGRSVVELSDGGFAIAGRTSNFGAGGSDVWLIRTDVNGNHLWNQTYGGTEWDYASSVVELSDGGFAIAGITYSFSTIGTKIWLVRTDDSGNLLWNRTYGGTGYDYGEAVVECSDGGFAVAGRTDNSGAGGWDMCLVRVPEGDPPEWVIGPTDQIIGQRTLFVYILAATDPSGLDTWWLNSTLYFTIDDGNITSVGFLQVGDYGLQVSVNDTFGNVLTSTFTVEVVFVFYWWDNLLLKLSIMSGVVGVIAATLGIIITKDVIETKRKRIVLSIIGMIIAIIICGLVFFYFSI